MKLLCVCFLLALLLLDPAICAGVDKSRQALLNKVIDSTLKASSTPYDGSNNSREAEMVSGGKSVLSHVCDLWPKHYKAKYRSACCQLHDSRVLHNIRINADGGFSVFSNNKNSSQVLDDEFEAGRLPRLEANLRSVAHVGNSARNKDYFPSPKFSVLPGRMEDSSTQCPQGIFPGTLHITGQKTVHVVYHTMVDNYAPVVGLVLMDAHANSSFLHKPRMLVVPFGAAGVPTVHTKLIDQLFSGGMERKLSSLGGRCFERIVWGWGPHIAQDGITMVQLRRQIADFARIHIATFYDLKPPLGFGNSKGIITLEEKAATATATATGTKNFVDTLRESGEKLNVVYFTRGNSSLGRSMRNEQLIVQAIQARGWANVRLCCDYHSLNTLQDQLALAYHADIVMGLHGAALTHGLFTKRGSIIFELKTVYGYESILFALIADAREGVHAQVSVRSYITKGGHKAADNTLAARVVSVVENAVRFAHARPIGEIFSSSQMKRPIGTISSPLNFALMGGINASSRSLGHFLGPDESEKGNICEGLPMMKYLQLLHQEKNLQFSKREHTCTLCQNIVKPLAPTVIKIASGNVNGGGGHRPVFARGN